MGKHSAKGKPNKPAKGRVAANPLSGGGSKRARAPVARSPRTTAPLEPAPQMRVHRERRRRTRRRVLLGLLVLVLATCVGLAGWTYTFMNNVDDQLQAGIIEDERVIEVLEEREPKEPFTLLLLGSDVRPGEEAARADTIILARIDPEAKQVWMISIPRDTRVEIPGYGTNKVNAANFYGGPALMIETVSQYMEVPINHYMEVDFRGFQAVVDALGGVWIDVPMEIDDWKASSHSPLHRASHIDPGYQLLDGEYALTFVRSRDFIDADWQRMRNQQLFFRELASQTTRFENLLKIPTMVRQFAEYTTTDLTAGDLIDLGQALRGMDEEAIFTTTLPGEWRSPHVIVDDAEKARLVQAMMAGEPFEPVVTEETLIPSDVSVAVRNGAGLDGVATAAADVLESAGFDIAEIGNANQFVYDTTLVIYGDEASEAAAALVLENLPTGELVASRGMYSFSTDVLVVVGKDWETASRAGRRSKLVP